MRFTSRNFKNCTMPTRTNTSLIGFLTWELYSKLASPDQAWMRQSPVSSINNERLWATELEHNRAVWVLNCSSVLGASVQAGPCCTLFPNSTCMWSETFGSNCISFELNGSCYCGIAQLPSLRVCVMSVRAAQLAVVLCIYRPFGCHPLGLLYGLGSNHHVLSWWFCW